jgi:uncharacterized protein (TIGR02246 family)
MAQQTAVPLDRIAQRLFELIDSVDVDGIKSLITDDCEEVDEISRTWRRGRAAVEAYFDQVFSVVSDIHTDISDVAAREWGDTGVVTCVIEQTYLVDGRRERITAPTTLLVRREDGDWRLALMHTVPLSDASTP